MGGEPLIKLGGAREWGESLSSCYAELSCQERHLAVPNRLCMLLKHDYYHKRTTLVTHNLNAQDRYTHTDRPKTNSESLPLYRTELGDSY